MIDKVLLDKICTYYNMSVQELDELINVSDTITLSNSKYYQDLVLRINQAKINQEKIFIVGDYDADGICSVTILARLFEYLGITYKYVIPDRCDGYGIKNQHIDLCKKYNFDLLIMVDNGIKATNEIQYALMQGLECIIIDHHSYDYLPDNCLILHSFLLEKEYHDFSASALALMVSNYFYHDNLNIVLASIGLIADCMKPFNQTRSIIKKAHDILLNNMPPVIKMLLDKPYSYDSIAFELGPKLNALGRLEDQNIKYLPWYFITKDNHQMTQIASYVKKSNEKRKELVKQYCSVNNAQSYHFSHFYLHYDPNLKEGLCGLLANQFMNEYKKPCLVLCDGLNTIKGSGRSFGDFDLYQYFNQTVFLGSFGGHKSAIGLSLQHTSFNKLKEYIETNIQTFSDITKTIDLEYQEIDFELVNFIESLKPFGTNFEKPLFKISGLVPKSCFKIKGLYPKWSFDKRLEGICFKDKVYNHQYHKIIGTLNKNSYQSNKISIMIEDIL